MDRAKSVFYCVHFILGICELSHGSDYSEESEVYDIIIETIDTEILRVTDFMHGRLKFKEPDEPDVLEQIFRNRLDLFLGVPKEIMVKGLDLKDTADLSVLDRSFLSHKRAENANETATTTTPPPVSPTTEDRATENDDDLSRRLVVLLLDPAVRRSSTKIGPTDDGIAGTTDRTDRDTAAELQETDPAVSPTRAVGRDVATDGNDLRTSEGRRRQFGLSTFPSIVPPDDDDVAMAVPTATAVTARRRAALQTTTAFPSEAAARDVGYRDPGSVGTGRALPAATMIEPGRRSAVADDRSIDIAVQRFGPDHDDAVMAADQRQHSLR